MTDTKELTADPVQEGLNLLQDYVGLVINIDAIHQSLTTYLALPPDSIDVENLDTFIRHWKKVPGKIHDCEILEFIKKKYTAAVKSKQSDTAKAFAVHMHGFIERIQNLLSQ